MSLPSRSVLASALLLSLVVTTAATDAAAVHPTARRDVTVLETYQRGLLTSMPSAGRSRLRAVGAGDSQRATPAAQAYVAADGATRWYAAAGLTAVGFHADCARLRSLPTVTDEPTALAAIRQLRTIIHAVERAPIRDRSTISLLVASLGSAVLTLEEAMRADPSVPGAPIESLRPMPLRLPSTVLEPTISLLEHARRAARHAVDSAALALQAGADRVRILDACVQSLANMASPRVVASSPARPAQPGATPSRTSIVME